MTLAELLARQTSDRYGRDPWRLADRLGLVVSRDSLPGEHREVYFSKDGVSGVILDAGTSGPEARELLSHAIGHHLLHVGDRLTGRSQAIWSGRHEREAWDFAACLLVPEGTVAQWRNAPDPIPVSVLAEELGVTESLLARRLRVARRETRGLALT